MQEHTICIILAGGIGSRLHPLTAERAKPAVPFGGRYRIIDFTLSNCLHSGLRRILVLTQYKSHSLQKHLRDGWSLFNPELGEYVTPVPPQMRTGESWYCGTADAIYQNLYLLERSGAEYALILSGDHIYRMDYDAMLQHHRDSGADSTVACLTVGLEEAKAFGVMTVDADDRVISFHEKLEHPPSIPGDSDHALASMGVYVFSMSRLTELLDEDHQRNSTHDFGKDILPALLTEQPTYAYRFYDENKKSSKYWRDIGTLDAFYDANMDLCHVDPEFNLYDPEWPMRTYQPQAPPAKFVFADEGRRCGQALDSIISAGCIISGSRVSASVLCPNVRVHSFCLVEDSILMPGVRVGRHARIRRAIVDRDVFIPRGAQVGYNDAEDRRRHTVTDSGIVVVTKADEPYVGPIGDDALRIEAEFDFRGSQ